MSRIRHIWTSLSWYSRVCLLHGILTQGFVGRDAYTGDEVAIKLEHYRVAPSLLDLEVQIYRSLAGRPGFPRVFWHGSQDDFQVMVFELLGPNLEDLFLYCGNRFSMKTTLMLVDQLLGRLENLHATGHHHRDIKPENFLTGTGKWGNVVYMTDLGLAFYRKTTAEQVVSHKPARAPQLSLVGTCRYASINGHLDVCRFRCPGSLKLLLTRVEQPHHVLMTLSH